MGDFMKRIPSDYHRDIKRAIEILKESGCQEIYLFGSLAEGRAREESDIDLAVRGCNPDKYYQLIGKLMMELEHPIDLVNLDRNDEFTNFLESRGGMVGVH